MWMKPNKKRLSKLDLNNFEIDDNILFCPKCSFQAEKDVAMKPVCPNCQSSLHISKVDLDLLNIGEDLNE